MFGLPIRPLIAVGAAAAVWYYTGGGNLLEGLEEALGGSQCQVRVDADVLNVRSGPGTAWRVVGTYRRGVIVGGQRVVWNGFRRLGEGRWSASRFLSPMPGARC